MYRIQYHKLVLKDDFKNLSKVDKRKIGKAIRKKLGKDPVAFGKVLSRELKGFYRLRIGIYRVVYRVNEGQVVVLVLKVGLRRDSKVYVEAAKRLRILG